MIFWNHFQLWIAGGFGKPNGQTTYHKTIEYVDENGGILAPGLLTSDGKQAQLSVLGISGMPIIAIYRSWA